MKELKVRATPDGIDIIEVDSQLPSGDTNKVVATVKNSHLLNAIYFIKQQEIDDLITDLTSTLRIARDCCDSPSTAERLSQAAERASKFRENIRTKLDKKTKFLSPTNINSAL